jgi:type IX secretion system PorP/SprF family membrane protein
MIKQLFQILVCILGLSSVLHAQDAVFSQYYATPVVLNPAFTGMTFSPRIASSYRYQWPGLQDYKSTAYSTYSVSYDQFAPVFNSGFGIQAVSDNSGGGLLRTNTLSVSYSYLAQMKSDLQIKLGMNAGFRQSKADWNKLIFLDQIDPIRGAYDNAGILNPTNEIRPDNLTKTVFDVGAGLLVNSENYYGGFALHHLTTPNESIISYNQSFSQGLPLRMTLQAGAYFTVKKGNKRQKGSFISPSVLFVKQGDQGQIISGAYYSIGPVFAGAWYRYAFGNSDAAIGMAGFQYDILKIGYSYDYTLSALAPTGGTHEISLILNFDENENRKRSRFNQRYNDCFKIFR